MTAFDNKKDSIPDPDVFVSTMLRIFLYSFRRSKQGDIFIGIIITRRWALPFSVISTSVNPGY